jgi:uncharacterized membrane protein
MLSDWFDRCLVIPGSLLLLFSGIVITWVGRWPLFTSPGRPSWLLVSLALLLLPATFIPSVLVPQRVRRRAALAAAVHVGQRTPELETALGSAVVRRLRAVELGIVLVVLVLMTLKPF